MLAVMLIMCTMCPAAFAATNNQAVDINGSWKEIYSDDNGIGANIYIRVDAVSNDCHVDIRMLDSSGTPIWTEMGSLELFESRTYWCGSNVYTIEARVGPIGPIGLFSPKKGSVTVIDTL